MARFKVLFHYLPISENKPFTIKYNSPQELVSILEDNFNIDINAAGYDSIHRITIPKNIHLVVRRIYIRQGKKDYDSVTFSIKKTKKFKGGKFWASLEDVNKIFFRLIQDTVKKP